MQIHVINNGANLTHVALEGSMDLAGANQIQNSLTIEVCTPRKPAIIDMAKVDFVCSLGMGVLVSCRKGLAMHKQKMVLLNVQPQVAQSLIGARLNEVLPMADSVEQAKTMLGLT